MAHSFSRRTRSIAFVPLRGATALLATLVATLSAACTLDDGTLTRTVPLAPGLGESGQPTACNIRVSNLFGDVVIEARTPEQREPVVADIPASRVATSSPSDAIFHWKGESDLESGELVPLTYVDDDGTFVIEDGCAAAVAQGADCQAQIHAWIPAFCNLEVALDVSDAPVVIGFSGTLLLNAQEAQSIEVIHDGDAVVNAGLVHDALVYCGDGEFEFDVGGDVVHCDAIDAVDAVDGATDA